MKDKDPKPFANCIVGLNLNPREIDFLKSLVRIFQFELVEFTTIKNIQFQKKELIFIREFNPILIEELLDWCLQITVVGRSTDDQKKILRDMGIIRFWDLNKVGIEEIPLFKKNPPNTKINMQILALSSDSPFNRQIVSLFQDFDLRSTITKNTEVFLFDLKNNDFSFIVLDWDMNEIDIQNISNELKNYLAQKGRIPPLLGIKNFQKENLFSDLTQIKNFCEILFSKEEILQLLITSLPIVKKNKQSIETIKQLNWTLSQNDKILAFSIAEIQKLEDDYWIENQKKMYDWLK